MSNNTTYIVKIKIPQKLKVGQLCLTYEARNKCLEIITQEDWIRFILRSQLNFKEVWL